MRSQEQTEPAQRGDVIEMTFDTSNNMLAYYKNESLNEIWRDAIESVNDDYQYIALRMEIRISGSIELLSWSRKYNFSEVLT